MTYSLFGRLYQTDDAGSENVRLRLRGRFRAKRRVRAVANPWQNSEREIPLTDEIKAKKAAARVVGIEPQ